MHHFVLFDTPVFEMLAALVAMSFFVPPTSAQESTNDSDTPLKKALDEQAENVAATAPEARLKAIEDGIDLIKKSSAPDTALKVGEKAPDFELPNAESEKVRLSSLLKNGPVVLTWYRGAWCPYCNIALRPYQKAFSEIQAAGATFVAISPQMPDKSVDIVDQLAIGFEVLSDRGNKVARAFGVVYKLPDVLIELNKDRLDLGEFNGDHSNELPLAATFIIDQSGVVQYAFVDGDFRKRAEPSEVLKALKTLKSSQ